MIRSKKERSEPIIIDLAGPDGNAYTLMRYAKNFGKQLGMEKADIDAVIEDMMSGDYEHLLEVFDEHFGTFVILER